MLTASFLQNLQQHLYKENLKLCLKVCLKVCIKFVGRVESLLQVFSKLSIMVESFDITLSVFLRKLSSSLQTRAKFVCLK